ncbi:hypothetical protein AC579_5873 [Pseudocercospora musae]|uniref:Rhamnogalacturonase A/B/Epimerase-like pectate lyase domain-containing protein n=1 Tax=Pseudocercospora musae TaxID=113226 RepID=A0A139HX54_9PEZI|nr:hypothetical protein AC579_5873 [Pseudocercospora musae]
MYSVLYALPLLGALMSTQAQLFTPPEVEQYVDSALQQYFPYTHYPGPSRSWWQRFPKGGPRPAMAPHPKPDNNPADPCYFWMEDIKHQGVAAFNSNPSAYRVFRNVKDFGAKGDGVTDDTAAINNAISSGGRCAPGACASSTVTPAVVYFPQGIYMVNGSIIDYYYTQIIGNPRCLPTIRAFATWTGGLGVIDANPYQSNGQLGFGATNVFWRQIRNLIIDTTLVPASSAITCLHWPTAQATSLQNMVFKMSSAPRTQHQGIFIEEGSGGFMNDLVFQGGLYGANWGNQQFTVRNLTFSGCQTAINQIWDWGWTYKSINIDNCTVGLNMSSGGRVAQTVGSVTFIDSQISNTKIGILTAHDQTSLPPTAGSLILENVKLNNVPVAIQGPNGTRLGNTNYIAGWVEGHAYTPTGPNEVLKPLTPNVRPASLLQGDGKYYEKSKPQFEQNAVTDFLSARDAGAKGDGRTDDTKALQIAINQAKAAGKILYLDHGDYLVSSTIYIPGGSRIVGESFSVILSYGPYFDDMKNPKPVVQIGKPGEQGSIQWTDSIVSTQGRQQGAVLFEYNLIAAAGSPSGLWDVHARVGGFAGSKLLLANCPKTPTTTVTANNLNTNCISGFLTMHITKQSAGLYLENVWLWVADHDVEDPALTQITVYAGRGLLDESQGPVWMVGTSVEHHVRYEYQFANARNVFAGQIQTETAYYQPNPNARIPFPVVPSLSDPSFPTTTVKDGSLTIPAADGWGLRIVNSQDILVYGAGLYSFFNNYSTACSAQGNQSACQNRILSVEGTNSRVSVYNLNTVGTHWPITVDGKDVAYYNDNQDGFVQTIALFRSKPV